MGKMLFLMIYVPLAIGLVGFLLWKGAKYRREEAEEKKRAASESPPEPKKYEDNSRCTIHHFE